MGKFFKGPVKFVSNVLGHHKGHNDGGGQVIHVPDPKLQEKVVQLEAKEQYAEHIEALKSVGQEIAPAAIARYLEAYGHRDAAEFVRRHIPEGEVAIDFAGLDERELKAVIEGALHHSYVMLTSLLSNRQYMQAALELNTAIIWCRENQPRLAANLVASGVLCFQQPQIEEKTLAEQPVSQAQEQPLVERLAQTVQLAVVAQPEQTGEQSPSEYLEPQEPNPAMLFASAQMPLPPFLAQPEIQENAPVQGATLVQDASVVSIRVVG